MARSLIWMDIPEPGWACSDCAWTYPVPALLSDLEARSAYDRLASDRFQKHECLSGKKSSQPNSYEKFAERARALILRGFLPKTAVEVTLHELEFELAANPKALQQAKLDAESFLQKIRKGMI